MVNVFVSDIINHFACVKTLKLILFQQESVTMFSERYLNPIKGVLLYHCVDPRDPLRIRHGILRGFDPLKG